MSMRSAGFAISRAAAHHRRWEIKQIGDPYLLNRRVIDEGNSRLFLMGKWSLWKCRKLIGVVV
ncbi:unnamed protein product [Arabidopsis halleri]